MTYTCACGKTRVTRPCTKAETKAFRANLLAPMPIHTLWHLFNRTFRKPQIGGMKLVGKKGKQRFVYSKKIRQRGLGDWRWTGYELMTRVARFAQKHPEIRISSDDGIRNLAAAILLE